MTRSPCSPVFNSVFTEHECIAILCSPPIFYIGVNTEHDKSISHPAVILCPDPYALQAVGCLQIHPKRGNWANVKECFAVRGGQDANLRLEMSGFMLAINGFMVVLAGYIKSILKRYIICTPFLASFGKKQEDCVMTFFGETDDNFFKRYTDCLYWSVCKR